MIVRKIQVKEQIEFNCDLQLYGYELEDQDVHDRFERFWEQFKEIVNIRGVTNYTKMMYDFKYLLYLEDTIIEYKEDVRNVQRDINYRIENEQYPKPWINEDLTNLIIQKFIESEGFKRKHQNEELVEEDNLYEDEIENEQYQGIIDKLD